ncbi:hypothetical protein [Rhodobacter capsulatus]|uniref:hypothetical protein n=1 Tax=Rhodobacter capsulatus TaxID=1061 RepID=UPI004028D190
MSGQMSKARQLAEIAFSKTQSQFLERTRALQEQDSEISERAAKTSGSKRRVLKGTGRKGDCRSARQNHRMKPAGRIRLASSRTSRTSHVENQGLF